MQKNNDLAYQVGLSFFEGIGPLRYRTLKDYFGSAKNIYKASKKDLCATGINDCVVDAFIDFRSSFDIHSFVDCFQNQGIHAISEDDDRYPKRLLHIKGSPFILYALGDVSLLSDKLIFSIVGTRKPTRYGVEVTKKFSSELSNVGFTIVSGMAMGIDAKAHESALDARGRTIAVLGCGVDICYPAINKSLYRNIIKSGLVVSEFPPGKRPSRGVFPLRNRIIAGLSLGVLVTEGAKRSGTLITAKYALDYGKDIFAVPGPITSPMSNATTILLQQGAKAVASVNDILEEYGRLFTKERKKEKLTFDNLSSKEKMIAEHIAKRGQVHVDEIVRKTDLASPEALSIVSALEVKGILQEIGDGEYAISVIED